MNAANRNDIIVGSWNETIQKPLTKLKQSTYTNRTENNNRSFDHGTHSEMVLKRSSRSAFTIRMNSSTMSIVKSDEKPSRNDSNYVQRPLFGMVRKYAQLSFDPSMYKCNDKQTTECHNKTNEFRAKILTELGRALGDPADESANKYNVEYEHPGDMIKYNPICMVLDAKLRILTNKDSPFDGNKIGRMFPKKKLFGKKYLSMARSCVIVSSAGASYRSGLGKFIGEWVFCFLFVCCALCIMRRPLISHFNWFNFSLSDESSVIKSIEAKECDSSKFCGRYLRKQNFLTTVFSFLFRLLHFFPCVRTYDER